METITKDILKNELFAGQRPAAELLYTRYSGMLFSYVLQFVPDREEASGLLVEIFSRLTPQLQKAFDSSLSIYCWLQVEARKIILEHTHQVSDAPVRNGRDYYFSLLDGCSPEHQWIFRELFIYGRRKEELAVRSGKDLAYISGILRDCLLIIRKTLV
ncbi:MAG TPA: hypothetical protein VI233_15035 [Puia sp.]